MWSASCLTTFDPVAGRSGLVCVTTPSLVGRAAELATPTEAYDLALQQG
jgi:hypothetical protein